MERKAVVLAMLVIMTSIMSARASLSVSTPSSFQFVMGTDYYAPTDILMPQKGTAFNDPNFHTTIVRVTDKADGYSGPGIENEYARTDPENSDGTYVVLRGNDGEWYLYDAATFQMKKHFTGISDGEEPEPRWDAADPKIFYYLYDTELRSYNVDTDASTTIHDFKMDFPSATYITTKCEGDASLDRRFWSFMVEDSSYNLISVIVFDRASNSIVGQKNDFPDSLDWVSMDMSGKHCIIGYDTRVAQVSSRDFSTGRDLPWRANGHMDLALTSDGRDVMVYQNTGTDWIAMADLDTCVETQLLEMHHACMQLDEVGIKTTGKLLERGSTRKDREMLAEKTGISEKLILEWVNLADLFRVKGVGSEYSDLLEETGVDTVVELARRNPENLHAKIREVNEDKKLVRRPPTLNQVRAWIEQAKKLPRKVEY